MGHRGKVSRLSFLKKALLCVGLLCVLVLNSCSTNDAKKDAQKLVGTWRVNIECDTWIYTFDRNGVATYTFSCDGNMDNENGSGKYSVGESKLVLTLGEDGQGKRTAIYEYELMADGKTLIISGEGSMLGSESRYNRERFVLEKQ